MASPKICRKLGQKARPGFQTAANSRSLCMKLTDFPMWTALIAIPERYKRVRLRRVQLLVVGNIPGTIGSSGSLIKCAKWGGGGMFEQCSVNLQAFAPWSKPGSRLRRNRSACGVTDVYCRLD